MDKLYNNINEKLDKYYDLMKPIIDSSDKIIEVEKNILKNLKDHTENELIKLGEKLKKFIFEKIKLNIKNNEEKLSEVENNIENYYIKRLKKMNNSFNKYMKLNTMNNRSLIDILEKKLNIKLESVKISWDKAIVEDNKIKIL